MPKKPTPTPSNITAIAHAAEDLGGEVRCFVPDKTYYIVVPLGQGENASVLLIDDKNTGREWIIYWPFGSTERRRFICPDLGHVREVLAELSVTPLPEKEISK